VLAASRSQGAEQPLDEPHRRNGQPEDIAHTFLFLASEEASFLTGQVLLVDGGVSLSLT